MFFLFFFNKRRQVPTVSRCSDTLIDNSTRHIVVSSLKTYDIMHKKLYMILYESLNMLFCTSRDVVYQQKIPVGRLNHVYCIIVNATCSFTFFFLTFNASAGSCGLVRIHIAK